MKEPEAAEAPDLLMLVMMDLLSRRGTDNRRHGCR
jgi:hypothetical protein